MIQAIEAAVTQEFDKRVGKVVLEKANTNMGIAPAALMLTSLFGPYNKGRKDVDNVKLAEYDGIKIFYTGCWLEPVSLNLLATMTNRYVRAGRSRVTVLLDDLIADIYQPKATSTGNIVNGQHYRKHVAELLTRMRQASFKIIEGGDDRIAGSHRVLVR